ncbi:magnesium/cobalt transporter CorA [Aureimonas leprariae]|uniref:Magnesium transport protein CorA n=1 Tax=Plantimonas leprariae TaxID=2615207 RepID=A0A7V7PPB8_9HYPH|nr:magnesium/cobalt transporter CorA [Aureimonas leprariae]KAB0679809.1 magnesium/cobalt transporter CorA [Aureimonas leprariae]
MTVVAAYAYANGKRAREVSIARPEDVRIGDKEFVWIGIVDPTDDELDQLKTCFDLHPLALEDAAQDHLRPKLDVYGDELFIVARTARLEEGEIAYGKTAIFVGDRHIITVRTGSLRDHTKLRAHLEESPHLLKYGVDYVLWGILDFVVDCYLPIVESFEEEILDTERRALDAFLSRAEINRIFTIRRELIRFRRIMGPMEDVMSKLGHLELDFLDAEARPYYRDVYDQVQRAASRVDGAREVISSVLEASSLLEQQRQGEITRQLAAWAAILAVPTAIAGIYGMNFDVMPELHWRYGYPFAVSLIVGIGGILFWRFRKAGWL